MAQELVLKAEFEGELRRLHVALPALQEVGPRVRFGLIEEAVRRGFDWPEWVTGAAPFVLKYADGDGDLCTLAAPTLLDALALAGDGPLRLKVKQIAAPHPVPVTTPGPISNPLISRFMTAPKSWASESAVAQAAGPGSINDVLSPRLVVTAPNPWASKSAGAQAAVPGLINNVLSPRIATAAKQWASESIVPQGVAWSPRSPAPQALVAMQLKQEILGASVRRRCSRKTRPPCEDSDLPSPRKTDRDAHVVASPSDHDVGEALQVLKRDIRMLSPPQQQDFDVVLPRRVVSPPSKRPNLAAGTAPALVSRTAATTAKVKLEKNQAAPKRLTCFWEKNQAAKMEKTDETEIFGASCDKCCTELQPGKKWYHVQGSCRDLCLECWSPLGKCEKQEFQRVYTPWCLFSDKEKYRVTANATASTACSNANEARCRSREQTLVIPQPAPHSEEPEFEPSAIIQRLRSAAETGTASPEPDCRADRCDFLGGRTVFYALAIYKYEKNGEMLKYNIDDLRSDIKLGRVQLVDHALASRAAPSTSRATSRATSRDSSVESGQPRTLVRPFSRPRRLDAAPGRVCSSTTLWRQRTQSTGLGLTQSTSRMAVVRVKREREACPTMERKLPKFSSPLWLQHSEYTEQQLETLQKHGNWLENFDAFLRDESLCPMLFGRQFSEYNVWSVIRQLMKFATGHGYLHPSANVYFRRNQPMTFDEDLIAVLHASNAWFQLHGKDKSCGWAIRHPVGKLLMYQRYVASGGNYQILLRGAER